MTNRCGHGWPDTGLHAHSPTHTPTHTSTRTHTKQIHTFSHPLFPCLQQKYQRIYRIWMCTKSLNNGLISSNFCLYWYKSSTISIYDKVYICLTAYRMLCQTQASYNQKGQMFLGKVKSQHLWQQCNRLFTKHQAANNRERELKKPRQRRTKHTFIMDQIQTYFSGYEGHL